MEWVGDLERAFASAIYPNRVVIAFVGVLLLVGLGIAARRGRWDRIARGRPRTALAVVVIGLAIVLPTGWYLGSPLFTSTTVDEPAPIVARATPEPTIPPAVATQGPAPAGSPAPSSTPVPTAAPTVALIERSGMFHGMDDFHFGRGTARLIETSAGSFTIRLEDFAVRNGPDLYVFLSPSVDGYAAGATEIGQLKADKGNQNYPVKAGTDIGKVRSVVIWCKQFAVLFATAPLE